MSATLFGPITQIGYVTDDIQATAKAWTDTTGIGPWTRMSDVKLAAVMNGENVEINIDVALTYKDGVQMELIKPLCDTPSPYSANKKAGLWGLHHMQFRTDDMEASLKLAQDSGLELVCTIEQGGGIYNYLRGPGVWFELMQAGPGLDMLFDMIKSASDGWDRKELIREFGL